MKTDTGKVCMRCGTLNDERSLMCVRCGETLKITEEQKYKVFKDKILSEKLFLLLFVVFFILYSYVMIFNTCPWIYDKLMWLGEKYLFNLFKNSNLIFLSLEVLYTLFLSLVNYIAVAIILYSIVNSKLMKKNKLNIICITTYIIIILSFIAMTIYKYKFDYVIILEHFMSIIFTFPYIKITILKRSI